MTRVTVTLLDWPRYPVETIYSLWKSSRDNEELMVPEKVREISGVDPKFKVEVEETFQKIVASRIPIAENLNFTFMLEGVSISLREQMVRHRVGVKVGERLGCDIIPDLASSTWWAQTMRILDLRNFAAEKNYRLPESLFGKTIKDRGEDMDAEEFYKKQMGWIALAYRKLLEAGIPIEDARELLPLGVTHRVSWTLNLASIQHIVGKRGCWIAQSGIWEPVILGMVNELAIKVHPLFRRLIDPPCFEGGKWSGCKYKIEVERRISGEDEIPPCPLYMHHHRDEGKSVV